MSQDGLEIIDEIELKKFSAASIKLPKKGHYLIKDVWNNSDVHLEVAVHEDEDMCTQSTANTSRPVSIENSLERYLNKFKDIKDNFERARCYNFQESDSEDDSNRNSL